MTHFLADLSGIALLMAVIFVWFGFIL